MALKDTIDVWAKQHMLAMENHPLVLTQRNGTDTTRRSNSAAFGTQDTLTVTHRPVGNRVLHTITYSRRPEFPGDAGEPSTFGATPVLCRLTFDGPAVTNPEVAAAALMAFRGVVSALADMAGNVGWPRPMGEPLESITAEEFAGIVDVAFGNAIDRILLGES